MKIKPMTGRIVIKRCEPEKKSGGIFIPDSAQEKLSKGIVLAVGPFEKDKEFDIKTGDTVFFAKWGGTEIKTDSGDEIIIMKTEDILGKEEA